MAFCRAKNFTSSGLTLFQRPPVATTSLIENWIDQAERRTWFLFEASRRSQG
jgi:hypothetical protein